MFHRSIKLESTEQQSNEVLELNISKVLLTNTRTDSTSDQKKLDQHLELFHKNQFFQQTQWPFSKSSGNPISPIFTKHRYDTYLYNNPLSKKTGAYPEAQSTSRSLHNYYTMTTDSLKRVREILLVMIERNCCCLISQQNMIFGIFMQRIFIWILLQHHHRKLFDQRNRI